ncbi:hypothetical protein J6590_007889 [Homalodisca vitripennis]|nr:hypothetical protein J6590_007889 [Homalodisca vitripennis]
MLDMQPTANCEVNNCDSHSHVYTQNLVHSRSISLVKMPTANCEVNNCDSHSHVYTQNLVALAVNLGASSVVSRNSSSALETELKARFQQTDFSVNLNKTNNEDAPSS